jgi:hypothetical protein
MKLDKYSEFIAAYYGQKEKDINRILAELELRLSNGTNKIIYSFSDGDLFRSDVDIFDVIMQIEDYFNKTYNGEYNTAISEYLRDFSVIDKNLAQLHKTQNAITYSSAVRDRLTAAQKRVFDSTVFDIMDSGVREQFRGMVQTSVLNAAANGFSIKDTITNLDKIILSSDGDKSYYNKYASQVAVDSIGIYEGTTNQLIADEYELTNIAYIGAIIKDSRPLCKHIINDLGGKVALRKIDSLIKAYPKGLKEGTNSGNFFKLRGGHHCHHSAIPIR